MGCGGGRAVAMSVQRRHPVLHFLHPVSCTQSYVSHLHMSALVDVASEPPEGKSCNCNDPSHLHHLLHGTLRAAAGRKQSKARNEDSRTLRWHG